MEEQRETLNQPGQEEERSGRKGQGSLYTGADKR